MTSNDALRSVPTTGAPLDEARARQAASLIEKLVANVGQVLQGKDDVIRLVVLAMLSEGHVLIEDVPGVGKTSLAKALARSIEVPFGRIQFTPDLLPGDVVGISVWDRSDGLFHFRPGPIFAGVVLADELNRASPKTQSALLEAMGERQVTVDSTTHALAAPFVVLATQNPLEHEGTYPLPESQLDRFLMQVSLGYPDRSAELEMLDRHGGTDRLAGLGPVTSRHDLESAVAASCLVHVEPALHEYIVDLAGTSRRHPDLTLGMSPRSTLALVRVSRARALAAGRPFVTPDDIQAMARVVLPHRLMATGDARRRSVDTAAVVTDLIDTVPVPRPGSSGAGTGSGSRATSR